MVAAASGAVAVLGAWGAMSIALGEALLVAALAAATVIFFSLRNVLGSILCLKEEYRVRESGEAE